MADLEGTVHIGRPVEEVFAFIADPRNAPRWMPLVQSAELVGDGPIAAGARIRHWRGKDSTLDYRVTALEPNRRLALAEWDRPRTLQIFEFSPEAGGTRLTCRSSLDDAMIGWTGPRLRGAAEGMFRRVMQGSLEQARGAIENPAAQPPLTTRAATDVRVRPAAPAVAPPSEERYSTVFLLAANLVPIAGVFWYGWDVGPVVLLYWAENLIVGFYNVLRMATASGSLGTKLYLIPFFVFHYGMFCMGHGYFVTNLFDVPGAPTDLDPVGLLRAVMTLPGMLWPIAALFVSHGVSFYEHPIVRGERHAADVNSVMYRPYARIIVLHAAILVGGWVIVSTGSNAGVLVILVGLKLVIDLAAHLRSHRPAPAAAVAS